jgi:hypothetical protein
MISIFSALLAAIPALAATEVVEVNWRVRYQSKNGTVNSQPSKAYTKTLKKCGYTLPKEPRGYFPISLLRCQGLLDFSSNKTLRQRVLDQVNLAVRNLRQENNPEFKALLSQLARVEFGISPFGLFQSARDGLGSPRRMGVNVRSLGLVVINKAFWAEVSKSNFADSFLLHEALGAAGYADVNYQTSLDLIEAAKGGAVDIPTISTENEIPYQIAGRDGTISVVGSGGDQNQQAIKASLYNAINQGIEFTGVDPKYLPSKAEQRSLVRSLSISIAPEGFFTDMSLCRSDDGREESKYLCGGFILNGAEGKPFLIVTEAWATAPRAYQEKMLQKIYVQIVSELAREKMQ